MPLLRRDLLKVSEAVGVAHPGLIGPDDVDIVEGTAAAGLREVYGYEPGWGRLGPALAGGHRAHGRDHTRAGATADHLSKAGRSQVEAGPDARSLFTAAHVQLRKTLDTWTLAIFTLMNIASASSRLVRPATSPASTSRSRPVSR